MPFCLITYITVSVNILICSIPFWIMDCALDIWSCVESFHNINLTTCRPSLSVSSKHPKCRPNSPWWRNLYSCFNISISNVNLSCTFDSSRCPIVTTNFFCLGFNLHCSIWYRYVVCFIVFFLIVSPAPVSISNLRSPMVTVKFCSVKFITPVNFHLWNINILCWFCCFNCSSCKTNT